MISLAQNGYTHEEVLKMLESSRTVEYDFDVFNNNEIKVGSLNSASGTITFDSESEIMGTANIRYLREPILDGLVEWRLRPALKLKSPKGWLKYSLGVYIMTTPTKTDSTGTASCQASGYDYNLILRDDKVTGGYFVAAGTNYVNAVNALLISAGIKKLKVSQSDATLSVPLEWEIGTSKLTIINELLSAINYEPIHFDSNGYAISKRYEVPENRVAEYAYQTNSNSLILPNGSMTTDMFGKANVFVRYTESPDGVELKSTYENTSPASPLSISSRGRRIVDIESVQDIADQQTLDDYTKRVAVEKSQGEEQVTITTAAMPHHSYRDCLYVSVNGIEVRNRYIEYGWSIDLSPGGHMSHRLKKVVKI